MCVATRDGAAGPYATLNSVDTVLEGTEATDRLSGGPGEECIEGGDGDDVLRGAQGNDLLRGGDGDDILYGGGNGPSGPQPAATPFRTVRGGPSLLPSNIVNGGLLPANAGPGVASANSAPLSPVSDGGPSAANGAPLSPVSDRANANAGPLSPLSDGFTYGPPASVTLLDNTAQPDHDDGQFDLSRDIALYFGTGDTTTYGYKLTSVRIDMVVTSAQPSYTASVYDSPIFSPGQSVGTLTKPDSLATGLNTFTSEEGINLEDNSNYFIVLDMNASSTSTLVRTASTTAVDTALPGWVVGAACLSEGHWRHHLGFQTTAWEVAR